MGITIIIVPSPETMFKKLEKSVILIDGLIQSPLSYTPTTTTLQSNGGTVGTAKTIFNVVGISSIVPTSILKINDEYYCHFNDNVLIYVSKKVDKNQLEQYNLNILCSEIQKLRKHSKLKPWQKIKLYLRFKSDVLNKFVFKNTKQIMERTVSNLYIK